MPYLGSIGITMQKLFLVLVIVLKLLMSEEHNWVLHIDIVLPRSIVPYYEWLIDFPYWQPDLEEPDPIELGTKYSDNQLSQ